MLQFLQAYFTDIMSLVETVIFVIVAFALTKKLGNPKFLQGAFETIMLKYKTESTAKKTVGQKFKHTVPVYEVDAESGELVKTDKVINIDELVNSSKDSALNSVYDRFLPDEKAETTVQFASHADKRLSLDTIRQSFEVVENYREKYHLPADMDATDVLSYVSKKSKEVSDTVQAFAEAKKNEKGEAE